MPGSNDFQIPPEQLQLHEILTKVVTYQSSLSDDRRTPKGFHHSAQGCGALPWETAQENLINPVGVESNELQMNRRTYATGQQKT